MDPASPVTEIACSLNGGALEGEFEDLNDRF